MDEKNGGPLSVLHVSKRGIFRFGFQNLGETLLGVLLAPGRTVDSVGNPIELV